MADAIDALIARVITRMAGAVLRRQVRALRAVHAPHRRHALAGEIRHRLGQSAGPIRDEVRHGGGRAVDGDGMIQRLLNLAAPGLKPALAIGAVALIGASDARAVARGRARCFCSPSPTMRRCLLTAAIRRRQLMSSSPLSYSA
jgi:hypothetical protein